MFKATYLTDRNVYIIERIGTPGWGTMSVYLINDERIIVGAGWRLEVTELPEIRQVSELQVIDVYAGPGGQTRLVEEYQTEHQKLLAKRIDNGEGGGEYSWANLDDEFAYRRYTSDWKPIYVPVTRVSEPLTITVERAVVDTGSPFVISAYTLTGKASDQSTYNRHAALSWAFDTVCEEAGLTKVDDKLGSHRGACLGEYSQPDHSGLRFAKVEGEYPFNENYDQKGQLVYGTTAQMLAKCKADILDVRTRVLARVAAKQGAKLDVAGAQALLARLATLSSHLGQVSAKRESQGQLGLARQAAAELQRDFEKIIAAEATLK